MVDQVDWSGAEHSLEEVRLMRHWLVDWRVRGGEGAMAWGGESRRSGRGGRLTLLTFGMGFLVMEQEVS